MKATVIGLSCMVMAGCTQVRELGLTPSPSPFTLNLPATPSAASPSYSPTTIETNDVYTNMTLTVPGLGDGTTTTLDGTSGSFTANGLDGTVVVGDQFSSHLNEDGSRDVFGAVRVVRGNTPQTYVTIAMVVPDSIQHTSSQLIGSRVEIRSITPDILTNTDGYEVVVRYAPEGSNPAESTNEASITFQVVDHAFVGGEKYTNPIP